MQITLPETFQLIQTSEKPLPLPGFELHGCRGRFEGRLFKYSILLQLAAKIEIREEHYQLILTESNDNFPASGLTHSPDSNTAMNILTALKVGSHLFQIL